MIKKSKLLSFIIISFFFGREGYSQITNGDFETGNSYGWRDDSNNGGIIRTTEISANSGNFSAYLCKHGGNFIQNVFLQENTDYSISFFAKSDQAPTSGAAFQVTSTNDINDIYYEYIIDANENWTEHVAIFTTPAGVSEVNLVWKKGDANFVLFLDDIAFENATSILNEDNLGINIGQNPSDGLFHIKSPVLINKYSVFNLEGKLIIDSKIINQNEFTVNLKGNSGIYILMVHVNNQIKIFKIMVKD